MSRRTREVLLLTVLTLALRLPFVKQAIGGDEPYYLAAAEHAQVEPWHPNHTIFVFQGRDVTLRGYPHPPGNAWVQAALLCMLGDVKEAPFHALYIVFSVMAVLSVYFLGARLSDRPFVGALLFLAVPVFVVNGNTLESDLPFLALWLTGITLYVWDRRWLATLALCGSGLISYQSTLALPILLVYDRRGVRSWLPSAAPLLTLLLWQVFEKVSAGQFPAEITSGYLSSYGYQKLELKLRNALALFIHSWFLIPPLLVPFAVLSGVRRRQWFLLAWMGLFLGAAMVLFYAGAARYVLPIAAPLAILASTLPTRFVAPLLGFQLVLSLSLATVNYQQWNASRDFALSLPVGDRRVWANAEWGLRYYAEHRGALPLHERQWVPTGDVVVTSDLAYPVEFNHGGRSLLPLADRQVVSTVPLRLIGLHSRSGYATAAQGFLPFGFGDAPIDRLHAELLVERRPSLSWVDMNSPQFDDHAVSGVYRLEENRFRWTAGSATFVLKGAAAPARLSARLYVPDAAPARHIELWSNGARVASLDCPGPGQYTITSPEQLPLSSSDSSASNSVKLQVDRSFTSPGDNRELGVILLGIGYR